MKRFQIRWPNEWLKRTRLFRTDLLSYSGKDFIVSVSLYLISVGFCLVLRNFDPNNDTSYVSMIFLLDVFLTALLTDGFFFSLTIAVFAVLSVDYIFTPPFWEVSFTLAGFPLTFLVMMTICVADRYRYQPGQEGQRDGAGGGAGEDPQPTCCGRCPTTSAPR